MFQTPPNMKKHIFICPYFLMTSANLRAQIHFINKNIINKIWVLVVHRMIHKVVHESWTKFEGEKLLVRRIDQLLTISSLSS